MPTRRPDISRGDPAASLTMRTQGPRSSQCEASVRPSVGVATTSVALFGMSSSASGLRHAGHGTGCCKSHFIAHVPRHGSQKKWPHEVVRSGRTCMQIVHSCASVDVAAGLGATALSGTSSYGYTCRADASEESMKLWHLDGLAYKVLRIYSRLRSTRLLPPSRSLLTLNCTQ